jgi:hypothetical protein
MCINCSVPVILGLLESSISPGTRFVLGCDCALSKTNYNISMTKYLPVVLVPYRVRGPLPIKQAFMALKEHRADFKNPKKLLLV